MCMEREKSHLIVRRTLNINNFESLTIEVMSYGDDDVSRIKTSIAILEKARGEMLRIFHVRKEFDTSSEYDVITIMQVDRELACLNQELLEAIQ